MVIYADNHKGGSASMQSLQVSASGNSIFVQMDDDFEANTADDDVSITNQRIFEVPLDQPDSPTVVSNKDLIFQAIGPTSKDGTFEYELFEYNWEEQKEKQLTHLKESASSPVIGIESEKVIFMVDTKFGQSNPDYHLYQMDLDGKNGEEILID